MKNTKENSKKKKRGIIGIGLSVALVGAVGASTLVYSGTKEIKKDNEVVLDDRPSESNANTTENNTGEVTTAVDKDTVITENSSNTTETTTNVENPKDKEESKVDNNKNETVETGKDKPQEKPNSNNNANSNSNNNVNTNVNNNTNNNVVAPGVKGKNTSEAGQAYTVNRFDVEKMVKGTYNGPLKNKKTVFLTFDDGPSSNTPKVLDILKKNDVHGTFFVLGNQVQNGASTIKRMYNEGNAIANHSYTHDFKYLYPGNKINVSNYMSEYYKTENALKNILGDGFSTNLVRMPGGENSRQYYKDPNLAALKSKFANEGIASVDWNALNGDAEGKKYTVSEMVDYVKRSSAGQNNVVVLMHDAQAKGLTVEALPQIIDYFKSQGYEFKTIG